MTLVSSKCQPRGLLRKKGMSQVHPRRIVSTGLPDKEDRGILTEFVRLSTSLKVDLSSIYQG